jgi:hypothetical protein
MPIASTTGRLTATAKPCAAHANPHLDRSRIDEAELERESIPASQMPRNEFHAQTVPFNTEAQALLLNLKMPILLRDSSVDLISTPCRSKVDKYQELAISFTFCEKHFIESMLAPWNLKAPVKDYRPC